MSRRRELFLVAAFTVLLHAPFLNQPVEGDEVTYLDMAREVFRQPLTPLNFHYVFQGRVVDAAGHPHPPLNAYLLALVWMLRGHFSELFFHVFYLVFALGVSMAAYALAAYFTPRALWCALLVAASPLVQVNTNTLAGPESPGLAFLLTGAAAFVWGRFWISGIALTLAGLTELQALALPPILLLEYALKRKRPPRAAWLALCAPFVGMAAWQAMELGLMHRLPGAVLLGYAQGSGRSRLGLKVASAVALLEHMGVLVIPVPLAPRRLWALLPGLAAAFLVHGYPWWERALLMLFVTLGVNAFTWLWQARLNQPLLAGWCLLYFSFAAVVFFAGASRYLLPLTAPMVLLYVLQFSERPKLLALALTVSLLLGLNVSFAAYEFARVYKQLPPPPGSSFLVNGEWGFRYYMLARGGRTLDASSVPAPGEWMVSSELSLAGNYDSLAEATAVPLRTTDLWVRTPLRVIDRFAHAGFSSVSSGLLSFSFSRRPLDRITYARTSPFLDVPGPWTPTQFSGHLVYLPVSDAAIRVPLDSEGSLRFALFGRGRGQATFLVCRPSGEKIFEREVPVEGNLWEVQNLKVAGLQEAILSVRASPGLRAGWGDLVPDSNRGAAGHPSSGPELSYLYMGDLRSKPQLTSGWYPVEEGAWRWMGKEADAVLRVPAGAPLSFEMSLYFPADYMQRAGGPVAVTININGKPLVSETYVQAGGYHLTKAVPPEWLTRPAAQVSVRLNRAMPPSGSEQRELGAVVERLGLVAVGGALPAPVNATLAK